MKTKQKKERIAWYRSPVSAKDLAQLNQRSNVRGWVQSVGNLAILVVTGGIAWYAVGRLPFVMVCMLLFLHGTFYAFLINGFHELCHKTVFKNHTLNIVFRNIYSFLSWNNPIYYWASHQEHHKHTLHPPDDLEVMLPKHFTFLSYLSFAFVNPIGMVRLLWIVVSRSLGILDGEWEQSLFPDDNPDHRRKMINWSRILLVGHGLLIAVSLYFGWWMLPILVTFAPFYGMGLKQLVNEAQHIGLSENVADYRLNTRTIVLNPFLEYVSWYMVYHIEHHMYAAVPCYNLRKLHQLIKDDLPYCPHGIWATWKHLVPILKAQNRDKDYRFVPELPSPAAR